MTLAAKASVLARPYDSPDRNRSHRWPSHVRRSRPCVSPERSRYQEPPQARRYVCQERNCCHRKPPHARSPAGHRLAELSDDMLIGPSPGGSKVVAASRASIAEATKSVHCRGEVPRRGYFKTPEGPSARGCPPRSRGSLGEDAAILPTAHGGGSSCSVQVRARSSSLFRLLGHVPLLFPLDEDRHVELVGQLDIPVYVLRPGDEVLLASKARTMISAYRLTQRTSGFSLRSSEGEGADARRSAEDDPESAGLPLPHGPWGSPCFQEAWLSTGNVSSPGGTFVRNDRTIRSKSSRSSSQPPGGNNARIR
jgi:hypothetical protein